MTRPFPVDATLTAIAIGYRNPAAKLIGRRVLPPLAVLSERFKWNEYPLAEGFTLPETRVGRKGQPNQVEFTATEKDGSIVDYGLDDPIPYSDIQEAATARAEQRSHFDPEAAAAAGLTNYIELAREVRAAALVQDSNNYAAGRKVTLAGNSQFSDFVNSDPYAVIDAGFDGTLVYRPNVAVMGSSVWSVIKRHPKLIKAVKGGLTDTGAITRAQFAELFELDPNNVLIGEAFLNTAKKGQNVLLDRVWGKSIQLLYVDPSKQTTTDGVITWGFTAELGGKVAGSIEDKDIGLQGGKRVRVGERVREFVAAKDVGYQINAAVA